MSIPPPPGPHQPQGPPGQPQGPYAQGQYPLPNPYGAPAVQGPYPHHPYGAYGPYGPSAPVNGVAIGALVLGILCFLPAVGLALGLLALVQIRKRGERGTGMAVAGSVLSTVGIALWALMLSTGAASDFWDGFTGAASGEGTAFALATGDCFNSSTGTLEGETYDVDEVPCTEEHDAEVVGVVKVPDGSFPGDDELAEVADDQCYEQAGRYALDAWAVPDGVDVYYLVPTRQSWRFGDRAITCMFGSTDGKPLAESLRRDYVTLDGYQVRFLSASNHIDDVLYEEPEAYPEDDLKANRAWAKDVHRVLGEQAENLRTQPWPEDAKGAVTEFLADMEGSRKEWAKAAAADDADTFYTHYEKAYGYVDGPTTVTARKALGLDTTVPTYEDDSDSGGEGGSGGGLDV
ncbi:DUF4190 domain-containing protein [Streptomyces sp. NBC_00299]|uniref:DUF4190 domain-containing protein n=1 Tax=Streptomyces sp. NBC_00299 TaxID=2975705 RepID=UPI002E2DBA7B|nr:DUF4190 domain-containing protein [Streptomyces sp. NBC_00299]